MNRWLPLVLLFPLAGCLEIEEEIVVRPDGSAEVRLTYRGDPAEFRAYLHAPPPPDWSLTKKVETEQTDKGPREKWVWQASKTFRDLNEIPPCFAPKDLPHRERLLHHPTRLRVSTQNDFRVYEFERDYSQMDVGEIHAVDDALLSDPKVKRLLDRIGEKGLSGLKAEEQTELFEHLAASEREKQMIVASRAVAAYARHHRLAWTDRLVLLQAAEARIRNALSGAKLSKAIAEFLAAHDKEEYARKFLSELRREILDGLAMGAPVRSRGDAFPSIASVYDGEEVGVGAGKALWDDRFRLTVRLPGRVIGGNGTRLKEDGGVQWEFDGRELYSKPMILRAISVEKVK